MPLKESEAIVLRSFPLGEGDRLVSFLSRSGGRMRGVAKGAQRPKSRFGSTLEPLSYIRIWFYERETRELVRINQCELIRSFLELQRDYGAGVSLALMSEITEAVLPEREASDAAFRLLLHSVREVERTGHTALPLAYFCLWTVRLGGWLPQLNRCVRCNRELSGETSWASPMHPGLLCSRCKHPGTRAISPRGLVLAQRMLAEKLEQLGQEDLEATPLHELSAYLLDLVEHHIERKLNSRRLMEANREMSL